MALKSLSNLDLGTREPQNAVIQPLAAAPAAIEGRIYYDSVQNTLCFYNGTAWDCLSTQVIVSTSGGNDIIAGPDGGAYLSETVTSLTAGTTAVSGLLYTDENGTVNTISLAAQILDGETTTSLSYSGTTLTFNDEDGGVTNIDLAALAADIFVNGGNFNPATTILTLTDNDGVTPDVTINLGALRSIITPILVSGIWQHDDGNGLVNNIVSTSSDANNQLSIGSDGGAFYNPPAAASGFDLSDGTNTDFVALGETLTLDASGDINIVVGTTDNTATIHFSETVTTLVASGTDQYVYTSEDGTETAFQINKRYTETGVALTAGVPYVVNHNLDCTLPQISVYEANNEVLVCKGPTGANTAQVTADVAATVDIVVTC